MTEDDPIIDISMKIIMHAGNSRNEARDALRLAREGDFNQAGVCLERAKDEIVSAHNAQTGVLQEVMGGAAYTPCLLFTHAQDTLMTVQTEINLVEELVSVLALVEERLSRLERATGL